MCALEHVLERMGLSMYLSRLQHEGFDTWETLMDITEEDLYVYIFIMLLSRSDLTQQRP